MSAYTKSLTPGIRECTNVRSWKASAARGGEFLPSALGGWWRGYGTRRVSQRVQEGVTCGEVGAGSVAAGSSVEAEGARTEKWESMQ